MLQIRHRHANVVISYELNELNEREMTWNLVLNPCRLK